MIEETQNFVFSFGPYRVCPRRRRFELDGQPIPVTAKAFDTLTVFLNRPGEVISKDELMLAVWPDTVVEENNLIQQISYLRKLLGERAVAHDFIVTVPGRGYSFVAAVHQIDAEMSDRSSPMLSVRPSIAAWFATLDRARTIGYSWAFTFIALVCLPFLVPGTRNSAQNHPQSLAVLGFRSSAASDASIGVGIRDTLRARLGSVEDLIVRPGPDNVAITDAIAAGRELNVEAVLTGSVQRSDERIRVTIEMIDVGKGRIVWGRIFDDDSSNLFELQDSIVGEVTRFLKIRFVAGFMGAPDHDTDLTNITFFAASKHSRSYQ